VDTVRTGSSIIFAGRPRCSATDLWNAIVDPQLVPAWAILPDSADLTPGSELQVTLWGGGPALTGVVVRVAPGRLLACVVGPTVVEWTIEPSAAGCTYRVTHYGRQSDHSVGGDEVIAHWQRVLSGLSRRVERPVGNGALSRL
jgi:uncharacterized protein YndB with AHSA1/START domain